MVDGTDAQRDGARRLRTSWKLLSSVVQWRYKLGSCGACRRFSRCKKATLAKSGLRAKSRLRAKAGTRAGSDRARGVIGSARQQVSRSVDVMTGADIRRFDEFTNATTRAVVGVHQDLSELREQVVRTHRVVDEIQERLTERLDRLEQSVGRRTSRTPWIVAVGAAAAALLLSIVAVLMSMS